jgi:ATP-dependent RNA helicase RhlE
MQSDTFAGLGVSTPVVDALAKAGIQAPFPIQSMVVPDALAGLDVLAKSPTGSGKTLAFGIPLVERLERGGPQPAAVVLVPTRELAAQVADDITAIAAARDLTVVAVYGGVPIARQAKKAGVADILIATPGRLEDLCQRRAVKLDRVTALVLDEADRMLDMGFQPQVDRLVSRVPKNRQTMFFSATLDGEVGRLASAYTSHPCRHDLNTGSETLTEIDHQFVPVTHESKLSTLVGLLAGSSGPSLVFVRTKHGADRLVAKLRKQGVEATAMHGDLPQSARERALSKFESGAVTTLVATDVAARGLDLERIATVVNYDPPEDGKGYLHRIGRTGRAGRSGTGITLVLGEQQADVSRIAARLELSDEFTEKGMTISPPRLVYRSKRGRNTRW